MKVHFGDMAAPLPHPQAFPPHATMTFLVPLYTVHTQGITSHESFSIRGAETRCPCPFAVAVGTEDRFNGSPCLSPPPLIVASLVSTVYSLLKMTNAAVLRFDTRQECRICEYQSIVRWLGFLRVHYLRMLMMVGFSRVVSVN